VKILEIIKIYPEYKMIVVDALRWLKEYEPQWNLDTPIDKEQFVNDLVERAMVSNKDY